MRVSRASAAACVLLIVATACGDPTEPSGPDLRGNWDLTFSASSQGSCPGAPQIVIGCEGSGQFVIERTTPQVAATHSYRAACQSCRGAFDYGVTAQPLNGATLNGGTLQFDLAGCRFAADVPDLAQSVAGTVACTVDDAAGLTARGSWTMSRR